MEQVTYVLGAGALGLLHATRLARTGKTVCLLVKPSQASALNLGVTLREGAAVLAKRVFVRVRSEPTSEINIQQLILATKAGPVDPALTNWQSSLVEDAEILI